MTEEYIFILVTSVNQPTGGQDEEAADVHHNMDVPAGGRVSIYMAGNDEVVKGRAGNSVRRQHIESGMVLGPQGVGC